jgi:hypothetical protein
MSDPNPQSLVGVNTDSTPTFEQCTFLTHFWDNPIQEYQLTSVLLEKLTAAQLVKNYPSFMEPKMSSHHGVPKNPPLDSILRQTIPAHILKILSNSIFLFTSVSQVV